jgi:hypothetical protein
MGRKAGRAAADAFYGGPVARQRERGRGSISVPCGGREWEKERGSGRGGGQRGWRGVAMPHDRSNRGEKPEADRWAAATVPGGGTG